MNEIKALFSRLVVLAPKVRKAIGSSTGGILGVLAGLGISDQSVIVVVLTLLGSILGTYFSPANAAAE